MVDHNMRGMDVLHVHGASVRAESEKMTRCSIEVDASADAILNRLSIPDADLNVSAVAPPGSLWLQLNICTKWESGASFFFL